MIVCTATAFIILVSGPEIYDPSKPTRMAGASLTQAAVSANLGSWTTWLMTILVFVFAFFLGAGQLRLRRSESVLPRRQGPRDHDLPRAGPLLPSASAHWRGWTRSGVSPTSRWG